MASVLNATKRGSALNQKVIALAYHFVREHQSRSVVSIQKMDAKDNYADPVTKALNNTAFHAFYIYLTTLHVYFNYSTDGVLSVGSNDRTI
jgi:hypothetical protein